MASVSTVFLDLDDTICEHPRSTADRLAEAFDRAGVEPFFDVADFRRWLPKVSAETRLELREKCFGGVADELGVDPALAREVARAYEDPDPEAVEFLPGAEDALDRLGAEYDLALVTNGGRETQEAKLAALGIEGHFDAATYTEPGGPVKPDPDHFHRTLSATGVSADEAVHVGNSLRADVVGAQAAGIDAVWLAESGASGEYAPEYAIESMADLREPPWV
ncbi:HAD family hydrolase [Halorussus salilacus]|uniref:HAD family hydrolase n=1 Tax=Halorussus salilacus TaxID=2953750 RepID=UPI00209D0C99|nr:HAD family hydrolase [Halorussus salilacus]USZ68699.1 HAD family hydrolase [Halorussus salilacus]